MISLSELRAPFPPAPPACGSTMGSRSRPPSGCVCKPQELPSPRTRAPWGRSLLLSWAAGGGPHTGPGTCQLHVSQETRCAASSGRHIAYSTGCPGRETPTPTSVYTSAGTSWSHETRAVHPRVPGTPSGSDRWWKPRAPLPALRLRVVVPAQGALELEGPQRQLVLPPRFIESGSEPWRGEGAGSLWAPTHLLLLPDKGGAWSQGKDQAFRLEAASDPVPPELPLTICIR